MEEFRTFLARNPHQGCDCKPYYDADTDTLIWNLQDKPTHGVWVNNFVTLYRSLETDQVIGCEIKGVQ